jgi:hypothetical protein
MKILTTFILIASLFSATILADDISIDAQKKDCDSNTAKQWSSSLNRCMNKVDETQYKNDAINCNKIVDLEERKQCQLNMATSKTGLSTDAETLGKSVKDIKEKSKMANGIIGTITAVTMKLSSSCPSKIILASTSLGGFLTDLLLKSQGKKKIEEITKKYTIDKSENPYTAQYKALQYLKEEQEVIKDMASTEKKKQMLLTIGYGAAAVMAMFDNSNPACFAQK